MSCFSVPGATLLHSNCLLTHFCPHKHLKPQAPQERTCKAVGPGCTSGTTLGKGGLPRAHRHQLRAHVQPRNPWALSRKQTLSPGPLLPGLPHDSCPRRASRRAWSAHQGGTKNYTVTRQKSRGSQPAPGPHRHLLPWRSARGCGRGGAGAGSLYARRPKTAHPPAPRLAALATGAYGVVLAWPIRGPGEPIHSQK